MSIVPFSYCNPFTESLKLDSRLFQFGERLIAIDQKWTPGGKGGTEIGFGASVYDCSIVLSYFLYSISNRIQGKSLIELGCGPGMASVVAGILLEPSIAVATDGDEKSVDLAFHNITKNANALNLSSKLSVSSFSKQLVWGNSEHVQHSLRLLGQDSKKFDYIIMSDIVALVYTEAFDDLIATLKELASKDTIIYLVYQRRHYSEDSFFEKLQQTGYFTIKKLPSSDIHSDFRHLPIYLYELQYNPTSCISTKAIVEVTELPPMPLKEVFHAIRINVTNGIALCTHSMLYKYNIEDKTMIPSSNPYQHMFAFDHPFAPPIIETDRLYLIPMIMYNASIPDHDAMNDLLLCGFKNLYDSYSEEDKVIWGGTVPDTTAKLIERFDSIKHSLEGCSGINWGIVAKDHIVDDAHLYKYVIGSVSFWRIMSYHFRAEVGYNLNKSHWNKGYLTEALLAMKCFGFKHMKLHSMEANIDPLNIASRKVLEKCGFVQEGYFKESYYVNGKFYDSVLFGCLE